MRYLTIAALSFSLMSFSREGDEIESIERLMNLTEKQLETQKELKELVLLFKVEQDTFANGNQTKEHTARMVTTAARLLRVIDSNNYRHLFSLFYLQELELFASIANKNAPARP